MEWLAECFKEARPNEPHHEPDAVLSNGPESVHLEIQVEDWLKRHGKPGKAWARIKWMGGDGEVHHIVRLLPNRGIELTNTQAARWPIWIPEGGDGGLLDFDDYDGDGDGDGEGDNVRRIFARFYDGIRWRKAAIGDPEKTPLVQRVKLSLGLIDESRAEDYGENHKRARMEQVLVTVERYSNTSYNRLRIELPRGIELTQIRDGRYQVDIPDDEIRRFGV